MNSISWNLAYAQGTFHFDEPDQVSLESRLTQSDANFHLLRFDWLQFIQKFIFTCATISSFIHDFRHSNSIWGIPIGWMYLSATPSHRCRHPLLMHSKKKRSLFFSSLSIVRLGVGVCIYFLILHFRPFKPITIWLDFASSSRVAHHRTQNNNKIHFSDEKKNDRQHRNSLFPVFSAHVQTHSHTNRARAIHRCTA